MTTVAFIPARGGSDRVPDKNLALVGETTLVGHAVRVAREAALARIVVSTDCPRIRTHALELGVEVHDRPAHLAGPHAQIEEAIAHWLDNTTGDLTERRLREEIVLLQPTSPFRTANTVLSCLHMLRDQQLDSVCTVVEDRGASFRLGVRPMPTATGHRIAMVHPSSFTPGHWDLAGARPRSQEARPAARESGAVYVFTREHFERTGNRLGGRAAVIWHNAIEAFEIDTPDDLVIARAMDLQRKLIGWDEEAA